jgi:hypothetical protein
VVGHHRDHGADAGPGLVRRHGEKAVVFVEPCEHGLPAGDPAVPALQVALPAEGLGADVEDDLARDPVADYRGSDEQRDLILRAGAEAKVV